MPRSDRVTPVIPIRSYCALMACNVSYLDLLSELNFVVAAFEIPRYRASREGNRLFSASETMASAETL